MTDWQTKAACKGMDTNWWFPDVRAHGTANNLKAVAICHSCPVAAECLADAKTMSARRGFNAGIRAGQVQRKRGWKPYRRPGRPRLENKPGKVDPL